MCGHSVTGKYPTNLKLQLKKEHKKEYDEVLKKEKQKEINKKRLSQSNIQGSFKSRNGQLTLEHSPQQKHRQYTKGSPRYMEVTKGWQPL